MKYIVDVPNQDYSYDEILHTLKLKFYDDNLSCEVLLDAESYTEPDRKAIEDEVWEFATNIFFEDFDEIFGGTPHEVLTSLSYQQIKEQYDAWKKEKEEIRVGDEVKHRGLNYVVGYVGADKVYHLIDKNWLRTVVQGGYQLIKTGRNFPEVAELLEKMRGEE